MRDVELLLRIGTASAWPASHAREDDSEQRTRIIRVPCDEFEHRTRMARVLASEIPNITAMKVARSREFR